MLEAAERETVDEHRAAGHDPDRRAFHPRDASSDAVNVR